MRPLSILVLALAVAMPVSAAMAQQMYSWKDRKGVTQYSDTPPVSGKFDTHQMTKDRAPTPETGKEAGSSAATDNPQGAAQGKDGQEDPRCATARQNVALLESKNAIQMSGSDGTAGKLLDAEERGKHLELAQASLRAYNCKPGTGGKKR